MVDLFEKEPKIFMGSSAIPAHLYSGVQYFDDISKESIRHCMHDAIAFAKTLPFCINPRPTLMAIAKKDIRRPKDLEAACIMNQTVYDAACRIDPSNKVFGSPSRFYRKYTRAQVNQVVNGAGNDCQTRFEIEDARWIANFAQHTNLDELQFPIFLIREYGLDMRYAAGFMEQVIRENKNIQLRTETEVRKIARIAHGIEICASTSKGDFKGEYHVIVDASGRNLGKLEEQVGVNNYRMVDVKLAGLFKLTDGHTVEKQFPEIYILGGKGYPSGTSFMSHISPINPATKGKERWMVVNVTTPHCTYVSDGKKSNGGKGVIDVNARENPLAMQVLNDKESHLPRLVNMVEMLRHRHEKLTAYLQPVCGIPGSVDVLGNNIGGRDSAIDAHADKRFISLNITKGGAAIGVAEALFVELHQNHSHYEIPQTKDRKDLSFIPSDIGSAIHLTNTRYRSLGFSKKTSRTYLTNASFA